MSFVYWIHLDSHLDITTDGYVGVANDFEGRMKRHATHTAKDSTHFARAVRLHGWLNLVKEVIYQGARAECMRTEQLLRHSYQIGWNEAIGGHGGGHISTSPAYKNRVFHGWSYDKNGARNPFYNKTHSKEFISRQNISRSTSIITMPDGEVLYGFKALGRKLEVHKVTAKRMALLQGWKIENKPLGISVN
jgi:predicted GIY-YIG superfamily endonuclease